MMNTEFEGNHESFSRTDERKIEKVTQISDEVETKQGMNGENEGQQEAVEWIEHESEQETQTFT